MLLKTTTMRQWFKYIIVSILAFTLFACENYDPDLYHNTPVIEDVNFTGTQKTKNTIEMLVTITLNKNYGDRIFAQVGNLGSKDFDLSAVSDNVYRQTYTLYASDFDQIDYSSGTAIFNNMIVSLRAMDGSNQILASFTAGNLRYQVRPSIKMLSIVKDRTYYKSGRYYTEFTFNYEVTGSFFFKDIYRYYIGNWSNQGKGGSLYDYGPEYKDPYYSSTIDYLYSMADTLYIQLRGLTGDNTEMTSNYTARFVGTGSGDVDISLVWTSSIPNTYSRSFSSVSICTNENSTPSKVEFKQHLNPITIEMTYDK